ncbi:Rho GTPase activating protein 24 [Echinococcus multilocularis]|uniref:Rho GTPase activating protein 24 n=1 Tax=Echinococcus multilocularis TaxID=6211 RepID=A0A068Y5S5_ECHMU|nr:Rho GTPase activating protein 24 [Echinococcus multilocularis]
MSTRKFSRSSSVRVPTSNGSAIQIQHCGWLRKQGGKFRTWKRRFFVLRQGSLEYYTDSEQIRLIGALEIGPPDIMEVVACETDVTADDKAFNFIVKKSKTWGSEQKQSLILSASSADERRDWIRALRKQLYLKLGGGLFGTHLSEVFAYTSPETKYVPRVVYKTAEFIRQYGLTTDGIFRKCGSRHVIEELCDAYDMARPDPILRANEHDAHAAAGVLKQYLRELPEPVIPYRQYDRLKATGYLIEDGQDLKPIIDQLECLPAPNYRLLQFLCQLLSEVAEHSEENRMTVENLASVFAPNILRQADYDPDVEMSVTPVITLTIAGFIRCHEELFRYELTHFAQLRCAALASTAAGATEAGAAAAPVVVQHQTRQNFSEPPPESVPSLTTSVHCIRHKSGSLTDNSNSQSRGQIWFSHDWHRATTLSRQSTTTDVSPNRRLNGRTTSADRDSSSCELGDNLQVAKRGSSSPADGSGVLAASEASLETAAEQLRHWRSVALVARAEAVCERAKSRALTAELARARCDLNMAETELGLLRKRLSLLESALAASRSGGFGAVSGVGSTTSVPRDLR